MLPEQHTLIDERWELFSTLTFDSRDAQGNLCKVPTWIEQKNMLFAFLRLLQRKLKAKTDRSFSWERLIFAARGEAGEQTGRDHFHVLLSGLPSIKNATSVRFALESFWRHVGGGNSQFRAFDPSLGGVKYVLKGLRNWSNASANAYEMGKFAKVEESKLILSNTFLRKWGRVQATTRGTKGTSCAFVSLSQSGCGNVAPINRSKESPVFACFGMHPAGVSFVR